MLRIIQNSSPAGAKSYYSTSDYYTEGQELVGHWRGDGAKRLGLDGTVAKDDWDALCDNQNPVDGTTLTPRQKQNRRVGYDFNFHVPKSVSLLYALTEDDRILDAFKDSVHETMREMEAEAKARVRKDGQNEDRTTGNLVWGEFVHFTARPEGGVPDPHLHAHCFVFNATYDNEESRWKAAQLGDIKRDAPYFEAVFHSKLAQRMEQLGLATTRTKHAWELDGIDTSTLDKFSRRTARIERLAEAKGITDPVAKAELGVTTRSRKTEELTMPQLRDLWQDRLDEREAQIIDQLASQIGVAPITRDQTSARQAADWAIEHVFERDSVVPERTLLVDALKRAVGKATREDIESHIEQQDLIRAERDGRKLVTTKEVLLEESRMLGFAREGRGACRPIASGPVEFHREWLSDEQKAAVRHVVGSRDRVILVRGAAGTGKTTMMQEAREAIEANGHKLMAFAPSADASRGVQRSEGFANADTVARLLADPAMQREAQGAVLWIDEAGLLGTKTTRAVFELAEKLDSRVLLTGDKRQHGSVERGATLRLLEDEAGLRPAEIKAIQRQRDNYKAAVEALSEGRVKQGFQRLDGLGWIREVGREDRERAIADAYLDARQSGESTLVISPTHAEGGRITGEIRRRMKDEGLIDPEGRQFGTLMSESLTLGEKHDPQSYRPGDVLVFHQNAKGHRKGERLVAGRDEIPFDQVERFTVYRPGHIEMAKGDQVRITKNGRSLDDKPLNNGDLYRVEGFTHKGDLEVASLAKKKHRITKVIPKGYGHLTHGFVVTSHASQGKTVDRVLIGQTSASYRASSREQFYVSVSRGRKQALVFTDDKDSLLDAVSQSDERISGTELAVEAARQHVQRQRVIEQLRPDGPVMQPERSHELEPAHV